MVLLSNNNKNKSSSSVHRRQKQQPALDGSLGTTATTAADNKKEPKMVVGSSGGGGGDDDSNNNNNNANNNKNSASADISDSTSGDREERRKTTTTRRRRRSRFSVLVGRIAKNNDNKDEIGGGAAEEAGGTSNSEATTTTAAALVAAAEQPQPPLPADAPLSTAENDDDGPTTAKKNGAERTSSRTTLTAATTTADASAGGTSPISFVAKIRSRRRRFSSLSLFTSPPPPPSSSKKNGGGGGGGTETQQQRQLRPRSFSSAPLNAKTTTTTPPPTGKRRRRPSGAFLLPGRLLRSPLSGCAAGSAAADDSVVDDNVHSNGVGVDREVAAAGGGDPLFRHHQVIRPSLPPPSSSSSSFPEGSADGSFRRVTSLMRNTRILTLQHHRQQRRRDRHFSDSDDSSSSSDSDVDEDDDETDRGRMMRRRKSQRGGGRGAAVALAPIQSSVSCQSAATAILLCGIGGGGRGGTGRRVYDVDEDDDGSGSGPSSLTRQPSIHDSSGRRRRTNCRRLPDDPTVQESIECIFASQLEEGLSLFEEDDDDGDTSDDAASSDNCLMESKHNEGADRGGEDGRVQPKHQQSLVAPSRLQQSILRHRSSSGCGGSNSTGSDAAAAAVQANDDLGDDFRRSGGSKRRRRRRAGDGFASSGRLVHIGTYDPYAPFVDDNGDISPSAGAALDQQLALEKALSPRGHHHHHRPRAADDASSSLCACRRCEGPAALPHPQAPPLLPPEFWPQRPLLMRPSRGTRVVGVRFSSQPQGEYLWTPAPQEDAEQKPISASAHSHGTTNGSSVTATGTTDGALSWYSALKRHWKKQQHNGPPSMTESDRMELLQVEKETELAIANMPSCPQCAILPINNGNEKPGEALVTDFETDIFAGTILVRLRHSHGTTPDPYDDKVGYFAGMNRRYQAVIRGRFKEPIPFTQCLTGFQLSKPVGKLPPKWIVKGALKVISFFAPQLDVQFDGPHPSSLTPLGSTPQSITVSTHQSAQQDASGKEEPDLEGIHEEPVRAEETLLGRSAGTPSGGGSLHRARFRKRHFDKLFTARSPVPRADPEKVYTFEFLQHLFDFEKMSIELGSVMGSLPLHDMLNGQPLQIMACARTCHGGGGEGDGHDDDDTYRYLWAFDLWHEEVWTKSFLGTTGRQEQ